MVRKTFLALALTLVPAASAHSYFEWTQGENKNEIVAWMSPKVFELFLKEGFSASTGTVSSSPTVHSVKGPGPGLLRLGKELYKYKHLNGTAEEGTKKLYVVTLKKDATPDPVKPTTKPTDPVKPTTKPKPDPVKPTTKPTPPPDEERWQIVMVPGMGGFGGTGIYSIRKVSDIAKGIPSSSFRHGGTSSSPVKNLARIGSPTTREQAVKKLAGMIKPGSLRRPPLAGGMWGEIRGKLVTIDDYGPVSISDVQKYMAKH